MKETKTIMAEEQVKQIKPNLAVKIKKRKIVQIGEAKQAGPYEDQTRGNSGRVR